MFSLTDLRFQDMDTLNTDRLMELQVKQLEKEKKELNERLRIVGKRVDHIERAYRKEERPLLGKDYEEQQANDRSTFEAVQKARIEGSRLSHKQDLETKQRMARMMSDYRSRRDVLAAKRGDEFTKRKDAATKKIEEEKTKRRNAVFKAREEEDRRLEAEERARQEEEEEEERLEAGTLIIPIVLLFYLTVFQNVSPRRRGLLQKRKLPKPLPKPRNVRQKRKPRHRVKHEKRNVRLQQRQLGSKCSAKKKLKDDENNAGLKNVLLPRIQLLLGLQTVMHQLLGDVLLLQALLHRHLFVLQLHPPGLKVQPRKNTDLGLWVVVVVAVDGEKGKLQERLVVDHRRLLLLLPHLVQSLLPRHLDRPGRHPVRMTMALNLYQRKRSGDLGECSSSFCTHIVHVTIYS